MQAKLGDSKGKRKEKAERQSKSLRELLAES